MSGVIDKFDRLADRYREHDYADPERYFERRAEFIVELGPSAVELVDRTMIGLARGNAAFVKTV